MKLRYIETNGKKERIEIECKSWLMIPIIHLRNKPDSQLLTKVVTKKDGTKIEKYYGFYEELKKDSIKKRLRG